MVRGFRISGTIVGFQQAGFAMCLDSDGQQTPVGQRINPKTGEFVFAGLPAGSYAIAFEYNNPPNMMYAEQDVTITTSDISGLQLTMQPMFSIPEKFPEIASGQRPQVQVQLISQTQRWGYPGMYMAQPEPNSPESLVIPSVHPGVYRVSAQSFGQGCIESVTSGSVDLTREDLTVSPGSQPGQIEVTLRNDCATISGTVYSEGTPSAAIALLVSSEHFFEPIRLPVRPNGTFASSSLPPGKYQIYAFSDIAGLEYADAEALKAFTSKEIRLDANQKTTIDLELNVRAQK